MPETFAGLPRKSSNVEKTGMAGLMVSRAEATYGDNGQKSVTLEVTDTGGISGLTGLASWVGMQGEKEDENGVERTQKIGDRLVHERVSKGEGTNEFSVVLGNRFVVNAEGSGVTLNDLKAAVSALDLGKLESMKGVGAQK
jgi:hypothetical protein